MPTVKDIIVRKPIAAEADECRKWPIWSCQPSSFDWDYTQKETCLIIEGEVTVKDRPGENEVSFGSGDLVIFPEGLKCVWQIGKAVKKHYNFD